MVKEETLIEKWIKTNYPDIPSRFKEKKLNSPSSLEDPLKIFNSAPSAVFLLGPFPNVEEIKFHCVGRLSNFKVLGTCYNLVKFWFTWNFTEEIIIPFLPNIKEFNVSSNFIKDFDFLFSLNPLTLESLQLSNNLLSGKKIDIFRRFPKLKSLSLGVDEPVINEASKKIFPFPLKNEWKGSFFSLYKLPLLRKLEINSLELNDLEHMPYWIKDFSFCKKILLELKEIPIRWSNGNKTSTLLAMWKYINLPLWVKSLKARNFFIQMRKKEINDSFYLPNEVIDLIEEKYLNAYKKWKIDSASYREEFSKSVKEQASFDSKEINLFNENEMKISWAILVIKNLDNKWN